ncbi:hypothetical protein FPV67DRAFT_608940 [Lyophyllum atratum]|nr:hypothetical protein FPV67DRAFT_608940 [Lyophyllum atratum]
MLALLLTFLALTLTASASHLAVGLPADEQLPVIARVNKPYSWSLSPHTFSSPNGALTYSTSALPSWLSFDSKTLNFYGTPSSKDEGNPRITITAKDSSSTVSSAVTLCVTHYPEPTLHLPISQQFSAPAPSLSSVFILASNSGLSTDCPALRIPPKWSFSIGFQGDTFRSENELYYEARLRDGSPLPAWMVFDPDAITVNGVTPGESMLPQPTIISLSLYASDQKGYSAASLPFDLCLAAHELSVSTPSLPTINVTADTPFSVPLSSPADFLGVLIDGKAIQPSEIMTLVVDTSQYGSWLNYDHGSRTLSGNPGNTTFPPGQRPLLLVTLTTTFNQSVRVPVHLAIVPSYFSSSVLPSIQAARNDTIHFDLRQDFSHATEHDDVNLTAAPQPSDVENWLKFNSETGQLEGTVPSDFPGTDVTVIFTAYSRVTHSTSHSSLSITLAPPDHTTKGYRPMGLSAAAHSRLVLGLGIAFGVIGGLCLIGGLLAVIRRFARVEDTAIGGEEGRNVWSEQDKKWYGIGLEKARGHGWANRDPNFTEKPQRLTDDRMSYNSHHGIQEQYGHLGLGLRRVSERSHPDGSPSSNPSPGVMSKREFFTKLRETVRVVSDKATGRKVSRKRPVIGRPILPAQQVLPTYGDPPMLVNSFSNPFNEHGLPSHPGSTIMTNSPSTSTAEHSIPRRRADFAPPRSPAQVYFDDARLSRQLSSGSTASNTSERIHAAEAVVHIASKATSIRSGSSGKGRSLAAEPPLPTDSRPRLVPFTSATRVPVPRRPSSPPGLQNNSKGASPSKRVVSQTAKVWKKNLKDGMAKGGSSDELKMGLHYVQSLGADPQSDKSRPG